jgi:hypothetical protein
LYYSVAMTLTVRLPEPLDHALEDYCAAHGLTKSHVVQESLARYLVGQGDASAASAGKAGVSANYAAFKRAGLIGCVRLGGASATKDVVRERVAARLKGKS